MPGIRRCGHCRNEGHNRTKCTKLQVDIVLNIHGRHQERYITPLHHCLMLSKINLDRLAQVKLLIDGQIPFMIFRRYCTYPVNNFMVCLDPTNNELTVTIVEPNPEVEEIAKNALIENAETITNYTNEYKRRIQHVKQGCIYWNYQRINNVITILDVPLLKNKTDGPYGPTKPYIKIGIYRIGETGTTSFAYNNLIIKNKK